MNVVMQEIFQAIVLLAIRSVFSFDSNTSDSDILEVGFDYIYKSVEDSPTEFGTEPENNNNSLKYALYTPSNPKKACYIQPIPEEFDYCPFNPSYKTQFMIHGFAAILKPGNQFDELKDALLDYDDFNVIIVNWTLYNNFPLSKAIDNVPKVGKRVAEMMHFMINHTGTDPLKFHCIGHSLGAHACGHAARRVPNFNRVTGLDAAGITISRLLRNDILLKSTDADYVDVIHTSFIQTGLGLGILQPIGDIDFYVNGGIVQKHCKFGNEYKVFKGDVLKVETVFDQNLCDHFISIDYFTNSISDDCEFLATECGSFVKAVLNPILKVCPSRSRLTARMGFHSEKIPGLAPRSVFYVDTLEFPPYCKEQK